MLRNGERKLSIESDDSMPSNSLGNLVKVF